MQYILICSTIVLLLILAEYHYKGFFLKTLSSTSSTTWTNNINSILNTAFATGNNFSTSDNPYSDTQEKHNYTNRLINEDSPYLLQHAHNPVDWYAWGSEAFEKAKKENKPIFLSIGYSTCHWCHVMEKESFENIEIAKILNEYFVSIKVDRERRPDIDATYMTAVQLISGNGGWPMSSFLTADGKTFYGGTYYTPEQFKNILHQIHTFWLTDKAKLIEQANDINNAVNERQSTHIQAEKIEATSVENAVSSIMSYHDKFHGGFHGAPKFPNESFLYLLLKYVERTKNISVMDAVEKTMTSMAQGGIYDQIAGGFHRYATDGIWLVPHFEKMLYNQANLSQNYLKAWQINNNPEFKRIVRQTLDYVLREMTAKNGGFYSATDADSEGEEGLYFIWTPQQIKNILAPSDAKLAIDIYGVTENGNFEGQNILHLKESFADYAKNNNLEIDEPQYINAAIKAAKFIYNNNINKNGELQRVNLNGNASVNARQEDYAYLAESFLTLFDITNEKQWLEYAIKLNDTMIEHFWDKTNGGFFMGEKESATVGMGRAKDSHDGAIPSGNSVALNVLQMLSRRTDNIEYDKYAEQILSTFSNMIESNPASFAYMLCSVDDLFFGELGAHQYAARGAITIDAYINESILTINISIIPGWHINSNKPLQNNLIATKLTLSEESDNWSIEQIKYPQKTTTINFEQERMEVYEGDIKITATLKEISKNKSLNKMPIIKLQLQACNRKSCSAPETLQLIPVKQQD